MAKSSLSAVLGSALLGVLGTAMAAPNLAHDQTVGQLTPEFLFNDQMPTGLTVTAEGRRFVSYPRWGDGVKFTVAELSNGREVPYPDKAFNTPDVEDPGRTLVSVQSVVAPADSSTLYYSALSGRQLYSVPTKLLRDRKVSAQTVQNSVIDLGEKGPSDGLLMGRHGRLYTTDYEHNAIHVLDTTDGHWSTLVHDPRLLWPDTMSLGPNGDLYVTANQLHRQPQYRGGHDDRNKPYAVFRVRIDSAGKQAGTN